MVSTDVLLEGEPLLQTSWIALYLSYSILYYILATFPIPEKDNHLHRCCFLCDV